MIGWHFVKIFQKKKKIAKAKVKKKKIGDNSWAVHFYVPAYNKNTIPVPLHICTWAEWTWKWLLTWQIPTKKTKITAHWSLSIFSTLTILSLDDDEEYTKTSKKNHVSFFLPFSFSFFLGRNCILSFNYLSKSISWMNEQYFFSQIIAFFWLILKYPEFYSLR